MLSQKFPFSYVKNMLTPRNSFAGRKPYYWWQIAFVVILLNAFILMPVSIHYAKMETYQIERIVDNGLAAITDNTYQAFQNGRIADGQFKGEHQVVEDSASKVVILPTDMELEDLANSKTYSMALTTDRWYFYYPSGQVIESLLSGEQDFTQLQTKEDVLTFINQQWYQSHRADVFIFVMLVYVALLYLGSSLIVVVGGLTLYVTRKAGIFDLKTLKECMGLLLNCLGLPSLIAMLASAMGLVENPIVVMNIQVLGSILMLIVVLYRTGFRDG